MNLVLDYMTQKTVVANYTVYKSCSLQCGVSRSSTHTKIKLLEL